MKDLSAICSPEDFDGAKYHGMRRPFAITYEGRRGAFASDGYILVILWDCGEAEPDGKVPDIAGLLDQTKDAEARSVKLRPLASWCGSPSWDGPECRRCNGCGKVERGCDYCRHDHTCRCEECGGKGTEPVEPRPGRLGGVPVNRVLLARALDVVPPSDVAELRVAKDRVRLDAPLWRIELMQMTFPPSRRLPKFDGATTVGAEEVTR